MGYSKIIGLFCASVLLMMGGSTPGPHSAHLLLTGAGAVVLIGLSTIPCRKSASLLFGGILMICGGVIQDSGAIYLTYSGRLTAFLAVCCFISDL